MFESRHTWRWVCCQHPMILLMTDEGEPTILERMPPWGAPSLHEYCLKMDRVLDVVANTPKLKLDFEISAMELRIFFDQIKGAKEKVRALLSMGKIDFVGCDYSQSHCHVFGSESALRQIAYGKLIFKNELGYDIDTFFHQETGVIPQHPQLLQDFGFKRGALFEFPCTIEFLDEASLEIGFSYGQIGFVNRETIANWKGPDGSSIPIYLPKVKASIDLHHEWREVMRNVSDDDYRKEFPSPRRASVISAMRGEDAKGMYRDGSIVLEVPDLVAVDEEYIAKRKACGVFSLLKDAFQEEEKENQKKANVRLGTYWSYCEGVWAELLSRKMRQAENSALLAEALHAMAGILAEEKTHFDVMALWEKILAAQHHDVHWIETRDLKKKAVTWLEEAITVSENQIRKEVDRIAARVGVQSPGNSPAVVVFNALPFARKEIVAVPLQELSRIGGADIGIYDDATRIPTQIENGCLYFRSEVGGFGYRSYTSKKTAPVGLSRSENCDNCDNCVLENDAVRVEINADGTIPSFIYKADGTELLNADAPGNELRGLLLGDNEQTWIANRGAADDSTISRGELFDQFRCTGAIKGIPYKMNVVLPHDDQPVLEFILELSFNGEKIGNFWDDETKLHLLWPLRIDTPTLTHDVPFGVKLGKEARPLFATNWIDLSAENHGFTLYNTGMVKHWVTGSTIANLLAWGGERFSNRSGVAGYECTPRTRQYLYGTHVFRYFINLHAGNWMEGGVERIAQRINSPQVCAIVKKGKSGPLPPSQSIIELQNENVVCTSIVGDEQGGFFFRGYEAFGAACDVKYFSESGYRLDHIRTVAGHRHESKSIAPYKIREIAFSRNPKMQRLETI